MLIPLWVLCLGALWDGSQTRQLPLKVPTLGLIAAGFLVQVFAVMIDMNLHYYNLLKRGVIQNVKSYSFPPKIYFDAQYSPLLFPMVRNPWVVRERTCHDSRLRVFGS
jgi:hypothetical protein